MKVINWVSNVLIYATMVAAAVLMLVTVADVTGRYLFNHPILGVTEITEYLLPCMLLAMAPCALVGRHVKIDILTQRFPPRTQAILECIYYVIGLPIIGFLCWTSFKHSLTALSYSSTSSMLKIPDFPFIFILSVSFAILFMAVVVLLIKRAGEVRRK